MASSSQTKQNSLAQKFLDSNTSSQSLVQGLLSKCASLEIVSETSIIIASYIFIQRRSQNAHNAHEDIPSLRASILKQMTTPSTFFYMHLEAAFRIYQEFYLTRLAVATRDEKERPAQQQQQLHLLCTTAYSILYKSSPIPFSLPS